jgi:hypothetical protein
MYNVMFFQIEYANKVYANSRNYTAAVGGAIIVAFFSCRVNLELDSFTIKVAATLPITYLHLVKGIQLRTIRNYHISASSFLAFLL